jgi:uncharacterized protein YggE
MRLAGISGALIAAAALAAPAPALAQAVQLPTLAPGEVLLEVRATGTHLSRRDSVVLVVPVISRGATPAEARRKAGDTANAIVSAATGAGISAAAVRILPPPSRVGFVGNAAVEHLAEMAEGQTPNYAMRTVEVDLTDTAQVEPVRGRIEQAVPDVRIGDPEYRLADPSAAQSAARANALKLARAQADDYARALGLRVARMLRIVVPPEMEEMMAMVRQMQGRAVPEGHVETSEAVRVEFALGPVR